MAVGIMFDIKYGSVYCRWSKNKQWSKVRTQKWSSKRSSVRTRPRRRWLRTWRTPSGRALKHRCFYSETNSLSLSHTHGNEKWETCIFECALMQLPHFLFLKSKYFRQFFCMKYFSLKDVKWKWFWLISSFRKTQEELNEKRHEAYKLSEALEERQRELQQRTMQVNEAYPLTLRHSILFHS